HTRSRRPRPYRGSAESDDGGPAEPGHLRHLRPVLGLLDLRGAEAAQRRGPGWRPRCAPELADRRLVPRDRRDPEDVPGRRQGVSGRTDRGALAPHPDRGLGPLHEPGAGRAQRLLGVQGRGPASGVVTVPTKGQFHGTASTDSYSQRRASARQAARLGRRLLPGPDHAGHLLVRVDVQDVPGDEGLQRARHRRGRRPGPCPLRQRCEIVYHAGGREPPPVTGVTGLWNLLPIVGSFIWLAKTQNALSAFWEGHGAVRT